MICVLNELRTSAVVVAVVLSGCGTTLQGPTDGGQGGGAADAGRTVTSSGTIGGGPANLVRGFAKVVTGEYVHLRLSSLDAFVCRTTGSDALVANEVSADLWVEPVTGQTLIGTFQFQERGFNLPKTPGTAGGFVARAPAVCPAAVGDGTPIVSGSITLSNTIGQVAGSLHLQSKDGETMSADFSVPTCELVSAAQSDCVP